MRIPVHYHVHQNDTSLMNKSDFLLETAELLSWSSNTCPQCHLYTNFIHIQFHLKPQRDVTTLTDYDSDSVFLPADAADDTATGSADGKVVPRHLQE